MKTNRYLELSIGVNIVAKFQLPIPNFIESVNNMYQKIVLPQRSVVGVIQLPCTRGESSLPGSCQVAGALLMGECHPATTLIIYSLNSNGVNNIVKDKILSVLRLFSGYTVKYSLCPWRFPQALAAGSPSCDRYI